MSTVKKYKEYFDSIDEADEESKAMLEQNQGRENSIIKQYKAIADSSANAFKDSIAQVDRQKAQAMQDINGLEERLARYIPEMNQRAGIAGTGMAESVALEMAAAQDAQRRATSTAYDTQKNGIIHDYRKAALEQEIQKQAQLGEIDLSNIALVGNAKSTRANTQKSNLGALGAGVEEGSVALQDYLDYYNKISGTLDPDKDIALIQQYKDIMTDNVDKKDRKDGQIFKYNGKYYKFTEDGVVESSEEEKQASLPYMPEGAKVIRNGKEYYAIKDGKIYMITKDQYDAAKSNKKAEETVTYKQKSGGRGH